MQFTIIETVVTTIVDTFPEKLQHRKPLVLLVCCTVLYLAGLIICTNGGMYVLQLMDNYCASFSALMIGLVEIIVISWVYGIDRFVEDIKVMLNHYPFPVRYWKFVWKYLVPTMIVFILVFSWIDMPETRYGDYVFPAWATGVGYLLSFTSVSAIPAVACYKIYYARGSLMTRIRMLSQPTADWGPKLQMHRIETHSPKHTDSQVPLALPNYNQDGDNDDDLDFPVYYNNAKTDNGDSESEAGGINLSLPKRYETGL